MFTVKLLNYSYKGQTYYITEIIFTAEFEKCTRIQVKQPFDYTFVCLLASLHKLLTYFHETWWKDVTWVREEFNFGAANILFFSVPLKLFLNFFRNNDLYENDQTSVEFKHLWQWHFVQIQDNGQNFVNQKYIFRRLIYIHSMSTSIPLNYQWIDIFA